MSNLKKDPFSPFLLDSRAQAKKRQLHRRTQSNSDFAASNTPELRNRLSTPQHIDRTPHRTSTTVETSPPNPNRDSEPRKENSDEKQVIIETLDLTPGEQLKLAGTAGFGVPTTGFFKFGKKRTLENCPKFMELMLNVQSPRGGEEEKKEGIELLDVSPIKEHRRNISTNYNKINEELMETESEVSRLSKRSSLCVRLSISKQKKDSSVLKSDIIEAIEELLNAEDGKNRLLRARLKKKGHSKSCFSFNLQAFNLKLKTFLVKKSMSIRKNEAIHSDSYSKRNSSQNNSLCNFSARKTANLRKSAESLMINKFESAINKHKKTSTSVFNPKLKNKGLHEKKECMQKIQEYDKKIKLLERKIVELQEKTENLETENKSLSSRILDAANEKKAGELEKEEYSRTIKNLEKRIKNNENSIKRVFKFMLQTDSTMVTDNRHETSIQSISQVDCSIVSPREQTEFFTFSSSNCGFSLNGTPKNLINLINLEPLKPGSKHSQVKEGSRIN